MSVRTLILAATLAAGATAPILAREPDPAPPVTEEPGPVTAEQREAAEGLLEARRANAKRQREGKPAVWM